MAAAKKKDDSTDVETVTMTHPDATNGHTREVRAEEVNLWRSQGWHKTDEDADTAPEPSNPEPAPAPATKTSPTTSSKA